LNGRDAPPSGGVEDCRHVTPTGDPQAANLAWRRVNTADRRRAGLHPPQPDDRVRDVKADWRGSHAVAETSTRLPETPAPV